MRVIIVTIADTESVVVAIADDHEAEAALDEVRDAATQSPFEVAVECSEAVPPETLVHLLAYGELPAERLKPRPAKMDLHNEPTQVSSLEFWRGQKAYAESACTWS